MSKSVEETIKLAYDNQMLIVNDNQMLIVNDTVKLAYENGVLKTLQNLMIHFETGVITQIDILNFVDQEINNLDKER